MEESWVKMQESWRTLETEGPASELQGTLGKGGSGIFTLNTKITVI